MLVLVLHHSHTSSYLQGRLAAAATINNGAGAVGRCSVTAVTAAAIAVAVGGPHGLVVVCQLLGQATATTRQ